MYKWLILLLLIPTLLQAQGITTIAGTGEAGYTGDNGPAVAAELSSPFGIARDASGNIYITDYNVIRKINTAGIITTVAGNGTNGFGGDGGPATAAMLYMPVGVAVDGAGNLYIADYTNNRVRKVNTSGIISTFAGTGATGYAGDGGPATNAKLYNPEDVTVDGSGNVFISDYNNNVIRKVNTTGIISTVAGTGQAGFSGDGGPATDATLFAPGAIAPDNSGNIYFSDISNHRVRRINISGTINSVAGNGVAGYSGDGGQALSAAINSPSGVGIDAAHNVYVSDYTSNVVRKITAATGVITTIVGNGNSGYSGDGGPATAAMLYEPRHIAVDPAANIYIADWNNFRVRKFDPTTTFPSSVTAINTPQPDLHVFPNPSSGLVTFSCTTYPARIIITNAMGMQITELSASNNDHTATWDAGKLPPGMYFYEASSVGGMTGKGSIVICGQ